VSSKTQASIRSLQQRTTAGGRQVPTQGTRPIGGWVIPPAVALSPHHRTEPEATRIGGRIRRPSARLPRLRAPRATAKIGPVFPQTATGFRAPFRGAIPVWERASTLSVPAESRRTKLALLLPARHKADLLADLHPHRVAEHPNPPRADHPGTSVEPSGNPSTPLRKPGAQFEALQKPGSRARKVRTTPSPEMGVSARTGRVGGRGWVDQARVSWRSQKAGWRLCESWVAFWRTEERPRQYCLAALRD
jgi:hypothetical protein